MKLAQILVCLCLFLIKGGASIYAATCQDAPSAFEWTADGKHPAYETVSHKHLSIASNPSPDDGRLQAWVHDGENEDEETNTISPLPQALLAPACSRPSYRSQLVRRSNRYKTARPLRGPTTAKYIVQGVLRI